MEKALQETGLTPLQARILARRGLTPETLDDFLNPVLSRLASVSLPGTEAFVTRVLSAIQKKEQILIFGDYDCDGVCATAILVETLKALGAWVVGFLPERETEGYGMTDASVARMLQEYPTVGLVITVDNGINSISQIAGLQDKGIDVIVTDHHLADKTMPLCICVHATEMCGAAIAFFLAGALIKAAKEHGLYRGPSIGGPLLVLAGLATVTDVMPLLGQNRILVAEALKRFRAWAPLGLKELFDRASRTTAPTLKSKDFGFLIGPRINAAGRIASGMDALKLILSTDREEARALAHKVDLHNTTRKSIEQGMVEEALTQLVEGAPAQVIYLTAKTAHPGVAGIVAARIMERVQTPVAVIVNGHGSARAPTGYHVRDALSASAAALERFGGHAAAGGFTVRTSAFAALFCEACFAQARTCGTTQQDLTVVDADVSGSDLTLAFAMWLQTLEPFGEGNAQPLFRLRAVRLRDVKTVGSDGRHLQITFKDSQIPRAVWWNQGNLIEQLRAESVKPYDCIFNLEVSNYGEPHPELCIHSLQVSE